MKAKLRFLFVVLAWVAGVHQAIAQLPVITSLSQNGMLVCTNLQTNTVASVEWASSPSGPWQTNWAGLDAVAVNSNGAIEVGVPMFFRVRGVAHTNSAPPNMVLIPAGSFVMGNRIVSSVVTNDPDITDAGPTNVFVSAFYMDINLITYTQWKTVYTYATNNGYSFVNSGAGKATNCPVETVNWSDCAKWSNARSQQAGLIPCYYTDAGFTHVFTNGDYLTTVYLNATNNGYRLPTEAEWEKAARGGLSGNRFPWGNTISESQANYLGDTNDVSYDLGPNGNNAIGLIGGLPYTSPVGSFAANGYGLFDMGGNVWEWCSDWYGTAYGQPTATNPTGPTTGGYRVLRGGDWSSSASGPRCALRGADFPYQANNKYGFRCVRGI